MLRKLAIGAGLLHVVVPGRVVDWAEAVAFDNPDSGRRRRWTLPLARLEGLAFVLLLRRGELPSPFRTPLGLFGFMLAAMPRRMLEFGLELSYENADDLEIRPWVVPVTRVLGSLYVVFVLFAGRADAPETEP